MLRVLGSPKTLCDGFTRRDLLQIGGAAFGGLALEQWLATQAHAKSGSATGGLAGSFGRAKRCIILFLYGSPSQLETFDMKPQAPVEVRGTMRPIASSLAGLDVCEHLPRMARIMDRATVVRSVTHPYPIHGVAYAMTGVTAADVGMELSPTDPRHHPYFGSCVEYLDRQQRGRIGEFVQNVALPFPFSSRRTDQPYRAGPYAAYLGSACHPIWTEYLGAGTTTVHKERPGFSYTGPEPYISCNRDSHFQLATAVPPAELTIDRLNRRRSLLAQFDDSRRHLERTALGAAHSKFQEMAYSLISSTKAAEALDVRREPDALRDLYGMTLFGQSCLAARRLIEAGTKLVSVFWDEYGLAGDAWDTHFDHFPRMIDQLCPGLDGAMYGLITDLEQRGLLDETLVVLISEHGRTPKINGAKNGGRDHWSQAYSALFAGGGIARGNVVGATDDIAGEVTQRPVSPKSLLATMYHLLGIDPHTTLPDREGRPTPLVPEEAEVVAEMLA